MTASQATIPVLSADDVLARFKELRARQPVTYAAFYSSQLGGIVTDPALMVLPFDDHMVHRGHGIFDTAGLVNGKIYDLDAHLDRFLLSAERSRLRLGGSREDMRDIIVKTTAASRRRDGAIRYWLSSGPGSLELTPAAGAEPGFFVMVFAGLVYPDRFLTQGARVMTTTYPIKAPVYAITKATNYLPNVLMQMEAKEAGFDTGVFIDANQHVGEGSNMNVAFVSKDAVLIHPRFDHILAGCTSLRLLELASVLRDSGLLKGIEVRDVPVAEARASREMMLMGSSVKVVSIVQWDDQVIGDGKPGPVARALLQLLDEDMRTGDRLIDVPYSTMRRTLLCLAIIAASQAAPAGQDYKTWKDYGGGPDSSHFVDLKQINKSNVNQLEVAWVYPTGDDRSYVFNPIVVDNIMYVQARNSSLVALDAATGREIWIHENLPGLATRGIAYWESKDRKDRRLIFAINNYLQEIDARTGKSILTFGNNGLVDLREGLGRDPRTLVRVQPESPGRVFENLIMLGSSTGEAYLSAPGDIRAYDVRTGKIVWTFHTIPRPGEEGYDTWPKDAWTYAGGTNTWGEITVDEKRGIAYFPTGSPTYDYYGADRIGSNLFGNCLLALDARTGKRLWHFQMVHHDLWDYDNNAAPQLITVRHDGKLIDAVSQSTKQGFLFVFDRVTGKPLWPIEERPVPKSHMPGEQAWPTQPYPTVPPPYARQKMTADEVNPYILTAEERAAWKERISKMRNEGLFTPPGLEETISLPGARGGSNWGTNAANPAKGMVYLTTQDWPTIYKLGLEDPLAARRAAPVAANADQGRTIYERRCQSCHGPDGVGSAGGPPALAGNRRGELEAFRQVVASGRGDMPAFVDLDATAIAAIHTFLAPPSRGSAERFGATGSDPVVGSGGAPGGLEIPVLEPRPSPLGGPPYPAGVDAPTNRYYTDWGLYPNQPYIIGPPWSAIVAYDLNTGTIKWRVPLGEDARAAGEGAKNAGAFMAERHGLIVTSTGLLFVATTDGKVRAHDEETGRILWTAALPAGSEGLPAMYEVNGRQYLVVPASSRINSGGGHRRPGDAVTEPAAGTRSYVAFALPRK